MLRVETAALSLTLLALAACSDSVGPNARRSLALSFATNASSSANAGTALKLRSTLHVVGSGTADSIVIDTAQVVLREIELRGDNAACARGAEDSDADSDGCEALKLGPELVSLPLTAGVSSPLTEMIPTGTYDEMEFTLHRPRGSRRDSAFVAAHPQFRNASVRVTGTYRGERFVFTSTASEEVELEFDPPVVVGGSAAANITVAVDVGSWFRTAGGQTIAPTAANASLIAERIRASFHAFEDGNGDGDDDSDSR